jgi:hypothetical protein
MDAERPDRDNVAFRLGFAPTIPADPTAIVEFYAR